MLHNELGCVIIAMNVTGMQRRIERLNQFFVQGCAMVVDGEEWKVVAPN